MAFEITRGHTSSTRGHTSGVQKSPYCEGNVKLERLKEDYERPKTAAVSDYFRNGFILIAKIFLELIHVQVKSDPEEDIRLNLRN